MVNYYLANYIGAGTILDPFRPALAPNNPVWSAIDLRPNPAVLTGKCLIALPGAASGALPSGTLQMGTGAALSTSIRNQIGNALGVTLTQNTPAAIAQQLLIDLAGGSRWKPLVPQRIGDVYHSEIHLGGLLWSQDIPIIAGGATATDDFNRANSSTVGGSWVEDLADWSIASNTLTNNGNGDAEIRNTTSLATDNQYAQSVANGSASFRGVGVFVRHPASSTRTYYCATIFNNNSRELTKRVAGTFSHVASQVGGTVTFPGTIRVEANGSTITGFWNGAQFSSATDTSIASGPHTGIFQYNTQSANSSDDFSSGDLDTAVTTGNFFALF